jgi:hypothetical protein
MWVKHSKTYLPFDENAWRLLLKVALAGVTDYFGAYSAQVAEVHAS